VDLPETENDKATEALNMIRANVGSTVIVGHDDLTSILRDIMHDREHLRPLSRDQLFEMAS
jgi:hypothetical protein